MQSAAYSQWKPQRDRTFSLLSWLQRNWFNLILVSFALHIFFFKDISFRLQPASAEGYAQASAYREPISRNGIGFFGSLKKATSGLTPFAASEKGRVTPKEGSTVNNYSSPAVGKRTTGSIGNLTPVLSPDYNQRHRVDPKEWKAKVRMSRDYVNTFAPIAQAEMKQFGIPASITLAQGLLESDAGDSRLALESNNHFGIKCRSKCKGCTCRNYTDDDVYDMFRVFPSVEDSYREHSHLLTSLRYAHLLDLEPADYRAWAHGLKKAGYATDKRYAEKLIQIIENLQLYKYDRRKRTWF